MLSPAQRFIKRLFDVVLAAAGIVLSLPIMLVAWAIASIETGSNGLFVQRRIGWGGKPFGVLKIKTMRPVAGIETSVTTQNDRRITTSGMFFRRTKIDELPQLWNVLIGQMSFVGPRPDVPGFADRLEGEDREILAVRPGITGPASLKYRDEEALLATQSDPDTYNREVIWPDKVAINRAYIRDWSLKKDIMFIIKTVTG